MIFKPFVLLASALATLQVANGAAIAERATGLCCSIIVNSALVGALGALLNPLLVGTGVTLDTGLAVGLTCTALDSTCVPARALSCAIAVGPVQGFGSIGINCSPTTV
ncbi:hypothetical protein R3P38DRAFT_3469281 [Favolaschia claudopus]|uniref:Hydrophobin n=1 Tax=Favolaschia claudopus TaxID=2862362 RepID=A0AAW0CQB1_9AGAR